MCVRCALWRPCVGVLAVCVLLLLLTAVTMTDTMTDGNAIAAGPDGNMAFAMNMYKLLREGGGNVFFSPVSIEVILALTYLGARGETARQMAATLGLAGDADAVGTRFLAVLQSLKSTDTMTLEVANRVFAQQTYPIEEDFKRAAQQWFLSAAQEIDFKGDPDGSRVAINKWVAECTHSKITDLIPPGVVDHLTRLVLVNAIYFKGKWQVPFRGDDTYAQPFYMTPTSTKDVPMMHVKKRFEFAERDDLDAKVLVLPYVGGQVSMVVVLPNALDGLSALEKKLDDVGWWDVMTSVSNVEVEVSLPRFKLEESFDLNDNLMKLGMVDMFDDERADFSGISKASGEQLVVSKVLHKAFVEVNEEGSEAAAATGVMMMCLCADLTPWKTFCADRPFAFALVNRGSRTVLFMGCLWDASSRDGAMPGHAVGSCLHRRPPLCGGHGGHRAGHPPLRGTLHGVLGRCCGGPADGVPTRAAVGVHSRPPVCAGCAGALVRPTALPGPPHHPLPWLTPPSPLYLWQIYQVVSSHMAVRISAGLPASLPPLGSVCAGLSPPPLASGVCMERGREREGRGGRIEQSRTSVSSFLSFFLFSSTSSFLQTFQKLWVDADANTGAVTSRAR